MRELPAAAWSGDRRLGGLRRFAGAITLLNIVGHTLLGFEQSWAQPVFAIATAYLVELGLETVRVWGAREAPRYLGGRRAFVDFLLPAHITGLAVSMLLYANDRIMPIVLGTAFGVATKYVFRVRVDGASRHFLNPSNAGIVFVLLLFPWVGIAQPYQFTENLDGLGDWALPAIIVLSGSVLNARFTSRVPLILSWLSFFVAQALVRGLLYETPLVAGLVPMTGMAFILFTFYMVTDPATSPSSKTGQLAFGASVAMAYSALMMAHVVFGLFFSLMLICAGRGLLLYSRALLPVRAPAELPTPARAAFQGFRT